MKHLSLTPTSSHHSHPQPPTRTLPPATSVKESLPPAKEEKFHPGGKTGEENARVMFVGTATTVLEWEGVRVMTDPNFLHVGEHVHLGPGVTGTRLTNPAVELHDLPSIDLILLSHYHADHFDQEVEASLRRDLPIITTPHAKSHLSSSSSTSIKDPFTEIYDLDHFDECLVDIKDTNAKIKVTGMPGKHVPPGPGGAVGMVNDLLGAVPPTNGWMLELGYSTTVKDDDDDDFQCGFRIYISGDTLLIPELREIPLRYPPSRAPIDLMLVHLGGTTIPSPSVRLLMVTMDAKQGVELVRLVGPDVTIPVHFDDYDVFLSPLSDFKKAMEEAGLGDKVVYLDRKDAYSFQVRKVEG